MTYEWPSTPPPVGSELYAVVRAGPHPPARKRCLVTASGVYEAFGNLPRRAWAHGHWETRPGVWSVPTRVLMTPWEPVP